MNRNEPTGGEPTVRSTGLICGCYWWEQAQKSGSDNECYGALASKYGGEWKIGSIDYPVAYCPWCGNLLPHIGQAETGRQTPPERVR